MVKRYWLKFRYEVLIGVWVIIGSGDGKKELIWEMV